MENEDNSLSISRKEWKIGFEGLVGFVGYWIITIMVLLSTVSDLMMKIVYVAVATVLTAAIIKSYKEDNKLSRIGNLKEIMLSLAILLLFLIAAIIFKFDEIKVF